MAGNNVPPEEPQNAFGFLSQVVPSTGASEEGDLPAPTPFDPTGMYTKMQQGGSTIGNPKDAGEAGLAVVGGALQGYTFGANEAVFNMIPPELAKDVQAAMEKHPGLSTAGAMAGMATPGSTASMGSKLIGGVTKTISGLGKMFLSEGAGTTLKAAPSASKILFSQGMRNPSATAGALSTFGLTKSEGYSTPEAALSATASFGLQKMTEIATGGTGKLVTSLTREDLLEIAKNPELYKAMKDKTVRDLLRIPVETTEKVLADARLGGSQQRLLVGRGQLQFVGNARRVLGNDFKQAAAGEIQRLGNPAIDMTTPAENLKKLLTENLGVSVGPRGEISKEAIQDLIERGYDGEILRIYNRLFTEGKPAVTKTSPILDASGKAITTRTEAVLPQPKLVSLSELSNLKQVVANRTNFSSGDKFDAVNKMMYGILNEATKTQAPSYYALTQKFSNGIRAIDDYKMAIAPGKKGNPGQFITKMTGEAPTSLDTKNDFIQRTKRLKDSVKFNDSSIQAIYNEALPQQLSLIDSAIDMTALHKKLPKAGASFQFFMSQPLDALRNSTFTTYAKTHPELSKVYDEVLRFKTMNRVFGIIDDTIKQVESGNAPNVVIGPSGAHVYQTSRQLLGKINPAGNLAMNHPNVILALDSLKKAFQSYKAGSNPLVTRILQAADISPKAFMKNLPIIMRSPQQRERLKQAISASKNYSQSIERSGFDPTTMNIGPIFTPPEVQNTPTQTMDLQNPNAQDVFTEEDPNETP